MKYLKTVFIWLIGILSALLMAGAGLLMTQYRDMAELNDDIELLRQKYRVSRYARGRTDDLSNEDKRFIYQRACYRQCHGEAVMMTTVLSPAGWFQVVERMRVREGVKINGRQAEVIIRYLEEEYPTVRSPYSFSTRKATHKAVWRNDLGEGDVYVDVIYATPEYLRSVGMTQQIDEFDVDNFHVFIISFTVHDGDAPEVDLDAASSLKPPGGATIGSAPPWTLRFQTADKHHYEGMVRFKRTTTKVIDEAGSMELMIDNVGEIERRTFRWTFPLAYPTEVLAENAEVG